MAVIEESVENRGPRSLRRGGEAVGTGKLGITGANKSWCEEPGAGAAATGI
jgi:hypothetical protein